MKKFKHLRALVISAIACFTLLSNTAIADIVVIVNAGNTVESISKADLGRIFLGKSDKFSTGSAAVPVNQKSSSNSRKTFDSDYLGRSTAQIESYWNKQLFSGGGTPPKEVADDAAAVAEVAVQAI